MNDFKKHLIHHSAILKNTLERLNELAADAILFIINDKDQLVGSLTDGDVRRGLLKDHNLNNNISSFINNSPKYIRKDNYTMEEIMTLKKGKFKVIPILDKNNRVINVINFRILKSYLPLEALVMAGGRGSRLSPMTDEVPKPLLKVGNKPIIEYNVDRLRSFGIYKFHISIRYLGEQIVEYFENSIHNSLNINFIKEEKPLGTIGAASLIDEFQNEHVLITNSDLLTTLNYEQFYLDFLEKDADMAVATVPYKINVPYAVMETENDKVVSFKEKPTYTYQGNSGIYIVRRELLKKIPKNNFYNTTDLMEKVLNEGGKLISFPFEQYWMDIGNPIDFEKAQLDIKSLDLQ